MSGLPGLSNTQHVMSSDKGTAAAAASKLEKITIGIGYDNSSSDGTTVESSDKDFMCSEGYAENEFEGKGEQMDEVVTFIKTKGFLPNSLVETEVSWFYK